MWELINELIYTGFVVGLVYFVAAVLIGALIITFYFITQVFEEVWEWLSNTDQRE